MPAGKNVAGPKLSRGPTLRKKRRALRFSPGLMGLGPMWWKQQAIGSGCDLAISWTRVNQDERERGQMSEVEAALAGSGEDTD